MDYKNILKERLNELLETFNNNKKRIESRDPYRVVDAIGSSAAILFCKHKNDGSVKFFEEAIEYIDMAIINQIKYIELHNIDIDTKPVRLNSWPIK